MNKLFRALLGLFLLAAGFAAQAADCPRIVSQSPYLTVALDWLERGDCIVGVSRYDNRKLPRTGGVIDPDVAAIRKLKPDLIVTSNWASEDTMRQATPAGAGFLRLDGFGSLDDAESMLRQLAQASRVGDGDARVDAFHHASQARAGQVGGNGRRVLLMSACSGMPYSFGRQHYIGDVFTRAGFEVVETAPKVRHLDPGEEIADIPTLVERLKPDLLFTFTRETAETCNAVVGSLPVRVVSLKGANFFHPGPRLIDGLAELAAKVSQ